MSRPLGVLAVCTGNICRSPAAERLLATALGDSARVASAGTAAVVGHPVDDAMAELLASDGVPTEGFRAQQLSEGLVREADLVLALTRDHRVQVVDLWPAAVRRTFTLTEFAGLVERVTPRDSAPGTPERLRELRDLAAAARSGASLRGAALDVPDPFGGPASGFEAAYSLIKQAVASVRRAAVATQGGEGT